VVSYRSLLCAERLHLPTLAQMHPTTVSPLCFQCVPSAFSVHLFFCSLFVCFDLNRIVLFKGLRIVEWPSIRERRGCTGTISHYIVGNSSHSVDSSWNTFWDKEAYKFQIEDYKIFLKYTKKRSAAFLLNITHFSVHSQPGCLHDCTRSLVEKE